MQYMQLSNQSIRTNNEEAFNSELERMLNFVVPAVPQFSYLTWLQKDVIFNDNKQVRIQLRRYLYVQFRVIVNGNNECRSVITRLTFFNPHISERAQLIMTRKIKNHRDKVGKSRLICNF